MSGYIGAISRVEGAEGVSPPVLPPISLMTECKISLYCVTFIFCPSKCNSKKSPICKRILFDNFLKKHIKRKLKIPEYDELNFQPLFWFHDGNVS